MAGGFQAGTAGAKDTSYASSYFDDDVRRVFDLAVAATRPVPEQPSAKPSKQGAPSQTPKPSGSAKPSAPLAPGTDGRDPRLKAIEDFWTPERMAQAKPVKEQEEREARIPRPSEAPSSQGVAPRSPSHEFAGIAQVGTFFYQTDENYRFCAGTVVPSPGKNIIASAGHCFDSTDRKTNMIFVPQHNEKNPFPHGKFAIKVGGIFMDAKYLQPDGDHKYTVTPQAETWKHAVEIGSGDYTGNDGWDLIVRWSDGEVTNYADFDGSSTWREHKWYASNELLTHAVLVTGGDFSDNPYADDTIIRWTDGELSLYTDGDEKGLGKQNPLVVPAK
ncbi:hypothetical protein [Streptomyces violascens]|uniref:hypothetical protein n=1 Tax=Streptomyces violascens TaxID=67381 RepID=UPI003674F3D3